MPSGQSRGQGSVWCAGYEQCCFGREMHWREMPFNSADRPSRLPDRLLLHTISPKFALSKKTFLLLRYNTLDRSTLWTVKTFHSNSQARSLRQFAAFDAHASAHRYYMGLFTCCESCYMVYGTVCITLVEFDLERFEFDPDDGQSILIMPNDHRKQSNLVQ